MASFRYKTPNNELEIRVSWRVIDFPACCGARVLSEVRVDKVIVTNSPHGESYEYVPLTKAEYREHVTDKADFFSKIEAEFKKDALRGKRYFATAPVPSKVVHERYAYYDSTGTEEPAVTMHTILRKTGWIQQESWVNVNANGNTISSFYNDFNDEATINISNNNPEEVEDVTGST